MSITFKIVDPSVQSGEWCSSEDPSPYVGLTSTKLSESLKFLQNPDEVVINKNRIKVSFSYPLSDETIIYLVSPDNDDNFTRSGLCRAIAETYQRIYDEEEKTTTLLVETVGDRISREDPTDWRCKMSNRACTDGKWGIWGHSLSDLDLHTVEYKPEDDTYYLGIDS